jgi:hypothetical protein
VCFASPTSPVRRPPAPPPASRHAAVDPTGGRLGKGDGAAGEAAKTLLPWWNRSRECVSREGVNRFEGEASFLPRLARFRLKLLAKPYQTQPKYGLIPSVRFWSIANMPPTTQQGCAGLLAVSHDDKIMLQLNATHCYKFDCLNSSSNSLALKVSPSVDCTE